MDALVGLFDFLQNPAIIIFVCVAVIAVIGALYKSKKMKAIAKICGWLLFFMIWSMVVTYAVTDYYWSLLLQCVPFLIFIIVKVK